MGLTIKTPNGLVVARRVNEITVPDDSLSIGPDGQPTLKFGAGGVPSEFGIGALTEIQGIALSDGVFTVLSLDPADAAHVTALRMNGLTLNAGKDGFVVATKGLYLADFAMKLPQHATLWVSAAGGCGAADDTGFADTIPPATVAALAAGKSFHSIGIVRANVGDELQVYITLAGAGLTIADSFFTVQYVGKW